MIFLTPGHMINMPEVTVKQDIADNNGLLLLKLVLILIQSQVKIKKVIQLLHPYQLKTKINH